LNRVVFSPGKSPVAGHLKSGIDPSGVLQLKKEWGLI